jgi:hypothetical protein
LVHMKDLNISSTTLINSAGVEVPLLRYMTSLKQCFSISPFLACCRTSILKVESDFPSQEVYEFL